MSPRSLTPTRARVQAAKAEGLLIALVMAALSFCIGVSLATHHAAAQGANDPEGDLSLAVSLATWVIAFCFALFLLLRSRRQIRRADANIPAPEGDRHAGR